MRRATPAGSLSTIDARAPRCRRSYHAFRFVVEEGVPVVYGRVHDRENSPWSGDHNGRGWPVFMRRPPRLCDVPLEPRVGLRDFRDIVKRVNHFTDLWQDYLALSGGGATTPYLERLGHATRWWAGFLQGHRHTFGQDGEECTLVVDAPAPGTSAALAFMPEAGDQVYRPRVMYCRCVPVVGRCTVRCRLGCTACLWPNCTCACADDPTPGVPVPGRNPALWTPAGGHCTSDTRRGPAGGDSTRRIDPSIRTQILAGALLWLWPCTTTMP